MFPIHSPEMDLQHPQYQHGELAARPQYQLDIESKRNFSSRNNPNSFNQTSERKHFLPTFATLPLHQFTAHPLSGCFSDSVCFTIFSNATRLHRFASGSTIICLLHYIGGFGNFELPHHEQNVGSCQYVYCSD